MEYAKLGKSDIRISRICLGCMGLGDARTGHHSWTVDEDKSRAIIQTALEKGINFFDTAIGYQNGTSEQYLGRALRDFAKREDVVVATKFVPRTPDEVKANVSVHDHIKNMLDASLNNLGMDYVDLYIYHMWDWKSPIEQIMETLNDFVKDGKVRAIGIANAFPWQLAEANMIASFKGYAQFVSVQNHYNLIFREEEREMSLYCRLNDIATTPYSSLAAGRLSRKPNTVTKRFEEDTYARGKYGATETEDDVIIGRVEELADRLGVSMTDVSLAWLLTRVTAPIVGATKVEQVENSVKCLDVKLTPEDIQYLEEAYVPHNLVGVMAQNVPAAADKEQRWTVKVPDKKE